jgi:hypothetical protein
MPVVLVSVLAFEFVPVLSARTQRSGLAPELSFAGDVSAYHTLATSHARVPTRPPQTRVD